MAENAATADAASAMAIPRARKGALLECVAFNNVECKGNTLH